MAENYNIEKTEKLQEDTMRSFGSFKVMLADILTFATVMRLATLFEYPPSVIEELEEKGNRSHVMIVYMEERGQIESTDITSLLNGLKTLALRGTERTVRTLFEEHTGIKCSDSSLPNQQREGKMCYFVDSLRKMYALWYNAIQPIPYIRERVYCVNDVYVQGGIKILKSLNSSQQRSESTPGDEPKTFSDIFDTNKISSNRILLEGDPGYGKSTFTLQAAYEWCLGSKISPLKMFQIFILLPLRLLGNISAIYTAIRLLLVPHNIDLTDDDIKQILNNCSSGVIVLDGYDEYPDKDSDSDVIRIIKGKMFPNFKVVLTSRSSSLPRVLDPSTVTIRLNGFDDTAMYDYIKRAVTGGNDEDARKIKDVLNSSPVLADICQIPMFCVLFAHITKERRDTVVVFNSVTSFFKYIISCFYSHMRNKDSCTGQDETIPDYKSLNKLAFDSVVRRSQQIIWPKKTFIKSVGRRCYNELINIGILIEETILTINDKPGADINDFIKNQKFVRFYHKLFAEWYAGNYLSSYVGRFWPIGLNGTLCKINPVDLQYVFRFASGLNKKACGRLVRYLERLDGGKAFASLCLFEQTMDQGFIKETVRNLISDETVIRSTDSKLLQRSNIQLLEVASRSGISISCVTLNQSFEQVDKDEIKLRSGQTLPKLLTVEKIHIETEEYEGEVRELSEDEVMKICTYALRSKSLKEISFGDCLLPLSLSRTVQAAEIINRNIKVTWCRYGYRFDFESGLWKVDDVNTVRILCSSDVEIRDYHSELLQRCTILLLENASNHDIRISCVTLNQSFEQVDKDEIKLRSGQTLPKLLTVEKILIERDEEKEESNTWFMNKEKEEELIELSEDEVMKICAYALGSKRLREISFRHCLLPLSLSRTVQAAEIINRNIKVTWCRYGYRFDFQSGLWKVDDVNTVRRLCSSQVQIWDTDSELLQRCTILLLENASNNDIPICSVRLVGCSPRVSGSVLTPQSRLTSQSGLILQSGLSLSTLSSLQQLVIGDYFRRLNNEEFVAILGYSSQCTSLKELQFSRYQLPETIPVGLIPPLMKPRKVKVWNVFHNVRRLNLTTGLWQRCDIFGNLPGEENLV